MRRIKKRNLNTIMIKRDAYVGNVKDEEEVIVEETVDITPERVTMEEKTEPVCADVAADVENSVEEAETEAEAAEEKAEADVAEETVAEEIGEADVAEKVEVAEETAPAEEVESVEEPVEEEAESVEEPVAEEIAEETAEPAEEVVEDTVTVTPDEVVFDEEEKPVAESEEADVEESVLESEAGESAEEPAEEEVVEDTVTITPDEVVFDEEEKPVAESEETDVEEAVLEAEAEETETAEAAEDTADAVEEVTEEVEEVPLEASEEESEEILDEEGSLDGTEEEVKELAQAEETEGGEVEETAEKVETEEVEEPESVEETTTEETETAEEEKPAEKTEKEVFKLTTPANQDDILSRICVKRGRKLIYRPNEIIFNCTAAVTGTDKNNEEGIKIKSILDEEIKQGVKLGYIDKYDGLKMSEIKEEYENDVVYEYAEQEFKRVGLVLDGEKVKVYVYDWDMKALHHIGFVDQANVADLKPYLEDKEKYSFDVCGLITGGKFRKVIKDEATGKITVEKGNDGKLGVELDISVINRKD